MKVDDSGEQSPLRYLLSYANRVAAKRTSELRDSPCRAVADNSGNRLQRIERYRSQAEKELPLFDAV